MVAVDNDKVYESVSVYLLDYGLIGIGLIGVFLNEDYLGDGMYTRIGELSGFSLSGVFTQLNNIDGSTTPPMPMPRSFSVGDVVRTEDGKFMCSGNGWKKV